MVIRPAGLPLWVITASRPLPSCSCVTLPPDPCWRTTERLPAPCWTMLAKFPWPDCVASAALPLPVCVADAVLPPVVAEAALAVGPVTIETCESAISGAPRIRAAQARYLIIGTHPRAIAGERQRERVRPSPARVISERAGSPSCRRRRL